MTPELTPQEIEQINKEAEEIYPDVLINERGIMELWEMHEHNDIQGCKREAYIAALTSERLKLKAEIQAYMTALEEVEVLLRGEPSEENACEAHQIVLKTLNQFK